MEGYPLGGVIPAGGEIPKEPAGAEKPRGEGPEEGGAMPVTDPEGAEKPREGSLGSGRGPWKGSPRDMAGKEVELARDPGGESPEAAGWA